jgi:hypothetical protein
VPRQVDEYAVHMRVVVNATEATEAAAKCWSSWRRFFFFFFLSARVCARCRKDLRHLDGVRVENRDRRKDIFRVLVASQPHNTMAQTTRASAKPRFDPVPCLASLVLRHVETIPDRLALACVSRVWRDVATAPGSWGSAVFRPGWSTVLVEGELASKLTDARLAQLLTYRGCAGWGWLEVHDAPVAFTFSAAAWETFKPRYVQFLDRTLRGAVLGGEATHFYRFLQGVDLSGCPGVTGANVLAFLRHTGICRRHKAECLDELILARCEVGLYKLNPVHPQL